MISQLAYLAAAMVVLGASACKPSESKNSSQASEDVKARFADTDPNGKKACSESVSKDQIAGLALGATVLNADQLVVSKFTANGGDNRFVTLRIAADKSRLPEDARDLHGLFAMVRICDYKKPTICQGPEQDRLLAQISAFNDEDGSDFDWNDDKLVKNPNIGTEAMIQVQICADTGVCGEWKNATSPTRLVSYKSEEIKNLLESFYGNLDERKLVIAELTGPAKTYIAAVEKFQPALTLSDAENGLLTVAKNIANANPTMRAVFGSDNDDAMAKEALDAGKQEGAALAGNTGCGLGLARNDEMIIAGSVFLVAATIGLAARQITKVLLKKQYIQGRWRPLLEKAAGGKGRSRGFYFATALVTAISAAVITVGEVAFLTKSPLAEDFATFKRAVDAADKKIAELKATSNPIQTQLAEKTK